MPQLGLRPSWGLFILRPMNKENLVRMGFVAHPHGLKGEAELRLVNPNLDECVLEEGMQVMVYPSNERSGVSKGGELLTISKLRFGNKVICQFEGVADRTQLEKLLPFELYLDRKEFPETHDDEVYLVDLIDMPVFSPDGVELGKLEGFSDNGMQYLFEVRLMDGSQITLPYVDAFFPEIDMENRKIVMIMPEYTE
jgi:16S rRNA processing protein RimM